MRILHFIPSLDLGGEQRYVVRLVNGLDRRFEQTVVYQFAPVLRPEIEPHVDVVQVAGRKLSARRAADWLTLARAFGVDLTRLIRARGIDVVTTHSPGFVQIAAAMAAKACRRPVVHTIQRPFGNHAPTEGVIARTPGLRHLTYGLCDRFVALGEAYAEDQVANFKIPAEKIALNYIGVDLQAYRPNPSVRDEVRAEFGIANGAPLVGVIARHNPEKAVGRGIRMFSHLLTVLPEARLLLVGDGPTRAQHEREVDDLKIRHAVVFAGARPDSARIMNGCDVIMQTTYNPLNGISSIEAMATGKPVLTVSEHEGEERVARDTCVEGVNGMFLRLTTPDDTARRMASLLRDPMRLAEMGRASRRMAEERFEISAHLRRLETLYESLGRRPS